MAWRSGSLLDLWLGGARYEMYFNGPTFFRGYFIGRIRWHLVSGAKLHRRVIPGGFRPHRRAIGKKMTQCNKCLNTVPALTAGGKRENYWLWPQDFECIMEMGDFPMVTDCKWAMELNAGEAISLQTWPGGIRRDK